MSDVLRDLYRRRASHYDITSRVYGLLGYRLDKYRRRGIDAMRLRPGDTVVELGCGTGANFSRLERAIGPTRSIIGVDLSGDMLEPMCGLAVRRRLGRGRWGLPERVSFLAFLSWTFSSECSLPGTERPESGLTTSTRAHHQCLTFERSYAPLPFEAGRRSGG